MIKIAVIVTLLFASSVVIGQGSQQANQEQARRDQLAREAAERRRNQEAVNRLRSISERKHSAPISRGTLKNIRDLYRKPNGKELKKLRPMEEDLMRYAGFLRNRKTGIIRLEPYGGCGDSTKVISASDNCVEYSMPGNGSEYSFRERNYRIGRLADIRFGDGIFSSPGVLQQGVFVGLGDVPLDSVGTAVRGMAYITDLKPPESFPAAISVKETLSFGTEKDGFYYAAEMRAVENMTYVLRSIAYRGRVIRSIGGTVFNEIDLDDRADITVAFRIVRKHESGGVTILWKELERKASPELIPEKPNPARAKNPFVAKDVRKH